MAAAVYRYLRWWRVARVVLLAVLPAALAACSWGWGRTYPKAEELSHLVWPEAPDRARIELVSVFAGGVDLGIARSIWTRMASLITGGGDTQMVRPAGVAVSGGRISVADPGAGLVHVYDLAQHRSLALAACGETALGEPVAVALLGDRIYVSDASLARIHIFNVDGGCEGGWGLEQGSRPAGIAADEKRSRLYVADVGGHRVLGFDLQGNTVLRFGSQGGAAGEFNYPTWLALDEAGDLYVTDSLNFRVQIFDPDGKPMGTFGSHGDGSGDLARPKGIGVDRDGHIYLVDALFDAVQIFDREGRYLMVFGSQGREPGHFWLPSGLAIDGDRIYVADSYNQRVQVFRFLGGEP
ncbi:MAG: 6-bladed beta-propeller [Candidatus Binatia bacterium]